MPRLILTSSREYLCLVGDVSATEQSTLSSSIWVGTMSEFSALHLFLRRIPQIAPKTFRFAFADTKGKLFNSESEKRGRGDITSHLQNILHVELHLF